MRVVRISSPFRNVASWLYLSGLIFFWLLARLFEPDAAGASLAGLRLPRCLMKTIFGIPCPFCGLTSGTAWLARWEWRKAWQSNILTSALLVASVLLAGYTLAMRLLAGRAVEWEPGDGIRRFLWPVAGLLIAASWLVNLLRHF